MTQVTLRNVRMAFADIWTAKPPQDGKGEAKFGATFILDPKKHKAEIKAIRDAITEVSKEKWKAKAPNILRVLEGDGQKYCYFEEDKLNGDGDPYDGFEGMYYISTKSPIQPTIIDRDRSELVRADGRPYSGCYVVAKVDIWAQDNTFGKGIRAQVQGVQFFADGDGFGGGTRAKADEFEDLSDLGEDDTPSQGRGKAAKDEERSPPARGGNKRRAAPVEEDDDIG